MRDDGRMTIASRCHQHAVRHFPPIVEDFITGKCSHPTIRFVHDQIGGGKVPVPTLPARKRGIEIALRYPAQPKRQRSNPRMQRNFFSRRTEPLDQRFWPGHTGKIHLRAAGRANRHAVVGRALPADGKEECWPAQTPQPAPAKRPRPGLRSRTSLRDRPDSRGYRRSDRRSTPGACQGAPRRRRSLPRASHNPALPSAICSPGDH